MDPLYLIMILVCLGGPFIALTFIAAISTGKRLLLALAFCFTAWVACNYVGTLTFPKNPLPSVRVTGPVPGCLDEVSSGQKKRLAREIAFFRVEQGADLVLSGWLASTLDPLNPPRVRLLEPVGTVQAGDSFQVKSEARDDVARFLENSLLEQCGFRATMHIPENMPTGRYRIRVERNEGQDRQYYDPSMEIQINEKLPSDPVVNSHAREQVIGTTNSLMSRGASSGKKRADK